MEEDKGLGFDAILKKYVGQCGRYQLKYLLTVAFLSGFMSVHSTMNTVFVAAKPGIEFFLL